MKRKCKTCGRTVGQYAYGNGPSYYQITYDQRVGKIAKDRWLQATSQFNSEYHEDEKKVKWQFPINQNARPLFCRQMCVDTFLEQFNETIDRLPNLIEV